MQAATLNDIARIHRVKGEHDEALAIHDKALALFEKVGDTRSRAMTLQSIASIRADKGELDQALALCHECLQLFDQLDNPSGRAMVLQTSAKIAYRREDEAQALDMLSEAYQILLERDRLDGIVHVGIDLGVLLAKAGRVDDARIVLQRSHASSLRLGLTEEVAQIQAWLDKLEQPKPERP